MRRRLALVLLVIATVSCGGGGTSLSGPSNTIPNVAGNYSGTATLAEPERSLSLTCPASTSVTQSGSTINVAPITIGAPCNFTIPVGQGTIDATGAILGSNTGTVQDSSGCGFYNYTGSGGFFGHDFRFSLVYTSTTCFNINFSVTTTKQ